MSIVNTSQVRGSHLRKFTCCVLSCLYNLSEIGYIAEAGEIQKIFIHVNCQDKNKHCPISRADILDSLNKKLLIDWSKTTTSATASSPNWDQYNEDNLSRSQWFLISAQHNFPHISYSNSFVILTLNILLKSQIS